MSGLGEREGKSPGYYFDRRFFLQACTGLGFGLLIGDNNAAGNMKIDGGVVVDKGENSVASGTQLEQNSKVIVQNDPRDEFGKSVALSSDGSTAVVGAHLDEDPNSRRAGSAYVFEGMGGSWRQQVKLTADDGDAEDQFGFDVALSADGSTAIIGAVNDEDPNGEEAGSAYVFTESGGSWDQQTKLDADEGDPGDDFGSAVAVAGDGSTVIVGADGDDDPNGNFAGSAYVFAQSDGSWQQQAKLAAEDGDSEDWFGDSVALAADGSTIIVGANGDEDPNGDNAGSAYVFSRSGSRWQHHTKLVPEDGDSLDYFGDAVALTKDGSTAVVGAPEDENPNQDRGGSAYVFTQLDGSWQQQAKLAAEDGEMEDFFGNAVAISGNGSIAIIGAYKDEGPKGSRVGSAYVFERLDGSWRQQSKLTVDDENVGESVALAENSSTTIIGAPSSVDTLEAHGPGSAYLFNQSNDSWRLQTQFTHESDDIRTDDDSGVGFGIGGTIAALISTGYLLKRRHERDNE